ncbi:hypothetical protein [Methylobacter tundripaludum]|uniref:hypothetical protein n=1 Tax=Methylobacter tundripaludum TaxID=173365 RepID=UPI00048A09A6|nr:hypothetical protein [Methylobacter tundripaludum]
MKFLLHSQGIKMGNEDEWNLVISDDKSAAHIHHWWSHRNRSVFKFKTADEDIPLKDFKLDRPKLYQKAIDILNQEGLSALIAE